MKYRVFLLALFLWTAHPTYGVASPPPPSRETWYERVLRQINPDDTNYGEIWEARKKAFMDRIGSPCFQYGFATTVTIVWLFLVLFLQHISHRRKEDIAVDSIADVLKHDAYSREKAREAIRRYNDHIEACNRVIEAEESGASRWVSAAELETLQSELEQYRNGAPALREETKRLREECEKHKAAVAELTVNSRIDVQESLPFAKETKVSERSAKDKKIAELVTVVNQLQDELIAERKKNQRIKETSVK